MFSPAPFRIKHLELRIKLTSKFFILIAFIPLFLILYSSFLTTVYAANVGDSCVYSQDAKLYDEKRPNDDQLPLTTQNDPNDTGVECFKGLCTGPDCGFNRNCQFVPDKSLVEQVTCPDSSNNETVGNATGAGNGDAGTGATGGNVAAASVVSWLPHDQAGYTMDNMISAFVGCAGIDKSLVPGQDCISFNQQGVVTKTAMGNGGAIGGISKLMIAMYAHPPTSTTEYLADVGTNLGIVKPAYAQSVAGTGDAVLKPILNMWRVMRNLSYLVFIIIFVVVGLMIMFRKKINPQTVISVQTALPGLVIGLVLVTFSYFLAALIVDLSYVAMGLVGFIFIQSGLANVLAPPAAGAVPKEIVHAATITMFTTNANIFNLGWSFIANDLFKGNLLPYFTSLLNVTALVNGIAGSQAGAAQTNDLWSNIITFNLSAAFAQAAGGVVTGLLSGLGILVTAVIIIALLVQLFRLLWQMISAYITVLIFAIAGPIFITVGSIPGRGAAITYWWKTLLANVIIFPTVFAVILFAGMFLANTGAFTTALPLFSGIPTEILAAIIGYGILLGSPAVPGMVKQAMGVKDIADLQKAAFGGLAAGFNVGRYAPQKIAERAWAPIKMQREAYRTERLRSYYQAKFQKGGQNGRKDWEPGFLVRTGQHLPKS